MYELEYHVHHLGIMSLSVVSIDMDASWKTQYQTLFTQTQYNSVLTGGIKGKIEEPNLGQRWLFTLIKQSVGTTADYNVSLRHITKTLEGQS